MIFDKLLTLLNGKQQRVNVADVLLIKRNTFDSTENLVIPEGETLILNCPVVDGNITLDGEVYIL